MGNLIVVEGTDGCGKETQSRLLVDKLKSMNIDAEYISFPNYDDESSIFVRRYLNGDYGERDSLSRYAVHSMYALDRYISYIQSFKEMYDNGCTLVADRYTISSIIYQSYGLHYKDVLDFKRYVEDVEYNKYGLPKPNLTIFLDVPPDITAKMRLKRNGKSDIHEDDEAFMTGIYKHSLNIAVNMMDGINSIISCCDNRSHILPVDDINKMILDTVESVCSFS